MASDNAITTVKDLVQMYTSGDPISMETLDSLKFQDSLTVRRDMQMYKKRTFHVVARLRDAS